MSRRLTFRQPSFCRMNPRLPDTWFLVDPGDRIRQRQVHGPFLVQRREELDFGGRFLTRHRGATETTFLVTRIEERSEVGLSCQVIHLEDERDGGCYVIDTGLMGPGIPSSGFEPASGAPPEDHPLRASPG